MPQAAMITITGGRTGTPDMTFGGIVSLRARIEARIERDIAFLDRIDGDGDLEFNGDEFEDVDGDYPIPGMTILPGQCEDDEDDDTDEDEDGLS